MGAEVSESPVFICASCRTFPSHTPISACWPGNSSANVQTLEQAIHGSIAQGLGQMAALYCGFLAHIGHGAGDSQYFVPGAQGEPELMYRLLKKLGILGAELAVLFNLPAVQQGIELAAAGQLALLGAQYPFPYGAASLAPVTRAAERALG